MGRIRIARILAITAIILGSFAMTVEVTSCATKKPIHAGAINQADSNLYDTLLTCQVAIEQAKLQFGNNAQARPLLNQVIVSYNTALDGYLVYHASGGGDVATVQSQLVNLVQDIAALQKQFGGGPKPQ